MKESKKFTIATTITGLVIIIATILPYFWIFKDTAIVEDTTSWGAFGDYFGGIINPFIGVANLAILTYITFLISEKEDQRSILISHNEDRRSAADLKNQKAFALLQMRHDARKAFIIILDKVMTTYISEDEKAYASLNSIMIELGAFLQAYSYLFPSINNFNYAEIGNSLEKLKETFFILKSVERKVSPDQVIPGHIMMNEEKVALKKELYIEFKKFSELRNEVLDKMVAEIGV